MYTIVDDLNYLCLDRVAFHCTICEFDVLQCFVASQERDAHHERKLKDHIALDTDTEKTKSKRPNPEIIAATGLLVHESKSE